MASKEISIGEWVIGDHGYSQVMAINWERPSNPLPRDFAMKPPTHGDRRYVIYKTFANFDWKPKTVANFEGSCVLENCGSVSQKELDKLKSVCAKNEKRWQAFLAYREIQSRSDIRFRLGFDSDTIASSRRAIEKAKQFVFPKNGMTLVEIAAAWSEAGFGFDFWEQDGRPYTDFAKFEVTFLNTHSRQNSNGLDMFDAMRVVEKV